MTHRTRLRRLLGACIVAGALAVTAGATTAQATSVDFCGRLIGSGGWCGGYLSHQYGTTWTYTAGKYYGGGSIDEMRAWMAAESGGQYYQYTYYYFANNTNFVNGCWSDTRNHNNYGQIYQREGSGAGHTIYGRNDDSPNHSGCSLAFDHSGRPQLSQSLPAPAITLVRTRQQTASDAGGIAVGEPAQLSRDLALFRRSRRTDDVLPQAELGDETRKAQTAQGTDVYVSARGADVCIAASGGSACGPASELTTTPVVLGVARVDGPATLYGIAADGTREVAVTTSNGTTHRIVPSDNVYELAVDGRVVHIAATLADGTKRAVLG